jgi:hypothetical protein
MKVSQTDSVSIATIERSIFIVRGQRVMLDSDLAALYGVPTAALNQAVQRNHDRFLEDFAFKLTTQEFTSLMSQIVISKKGRGGRRKLPWVFTEHGVAMLSSVLRSTTAVKVNVEIMRAFIRLRRFFATPGEVISELTKLRDKTKLHDEQIAVISKVLEQLLAPPDPPKRRIGF